MTKQQRLDIANQIIAIIASHGRHFFSLHADGGGKGQPDRLSRFELRNNRVWFIDKFTQKPIYTAYRGHWQAFSDGGTLHEIVEELSDWIRGISSHPNCYLGPWHKSCCDGDPWGYGPDMPIVRDKIRSLLSTIIP